LDKYTLVVTEKPDAAIRLASALDSAGKPKKNLKGRVPYYVANRNGKIIVVPALGHLYTVWSSSTGRKNLPNFDFNWVPLHVVNKEKRYLRAWVEAIRELSEEAVDFVDACDYDIEGSIIGYCILKYACGGKENSAKRMKYSTLTKEELEKAYDNLLPHLDFKLVEAGLARHEIDWLYGINLSRILTEAAKKASNRYSIISTGRVQGPALRFLTLRERNIGVFVPLPYWILRAFVQIGDEILEAGHERKRFDAKTEAEDAVNACKMNAAEISSIKKRNYLQMPPVPFDLGSLQSEAYRLFGYSPIRTLKIAQRLYLDALISYPRTSSQRLPPEIGYKKILGKLAENRKYSKSASYLLLKSNLKAFEGKKQDSAHPAIYPTGKHPEKTLNPAENKIYDLVVHRFFAAFGGPAGKQNIKITIRTGEEKIFLKETQILCSGWIQLYEPFARIQGKPLLAVEEGDKVVIKKIVLEDKYTSPPPRYNPSSLLKKMESENIGTKATRASIIQTLYDRQYITNEKISVAEIGLQVTDVLKKYCPNLISSRFTRQLEERMEAIQREEEGKEQLVSDAKENLGKIIAALKNNEKIVGEQLSGAILKRDLEMRTIGTCPDCQDGKLVILKSKKTGKRFVGCTNYFKGNCNTSFPLPQKGKLKSSPLKCEHCSGLMVNVLMRGKRGWDLCLNPKCSSKKGKKVGLQAL
jgi:DNA topoisomerase-1